MLGGVLVQGWLLVRFSSAGMTAFILDAGQYRGRWWHQNEPLFAIAGFVVLVLATFLLALAWTRALRTPPVRPESAKVADGEDGDEAAASIDLPAFLRPKTRRVRRGAGTLTGLTLLSVLVLALGVGLGVFEAFQMYTVLQNNQGNAAALQRNSTVWILRLMHWIAPAVASLGAVLLGFTWGRFWPLQPAEVVVIGEAKQPATARSGAEWQTFD